MRRALIYMKGREEALQANRLLAGRNIWTGEPVAPAPDQRVDSPAPQRTWLDDNPTAKALGGAAALGAGVVAGIPRGAVHNLQGAANGLGFVARLFDPADPFLYPPGEAAWDELFGATGQAARYVGSRVQDPREFADDIQQLVQDQNLRLNPAATPQSDTFAGELRRGFDIGQNDGEAVLDVGTLIGGGEMLKGLQAASAASKAARAARYVDELDLHPAQAERWAERYEGMTHHVIPRGWRFQERIGPLKVPQALVGKPLPKVLLESPFNRLDPAGLDYFQFNKLHYGVDNQFYGGRLPGKGGWSGKKWGFKRYGMPARLWYGTPDATKWSLLGPQLAGQASNAAAGLGDER